MNKPILVIMAAGMGSRYGGLKQIDPIDEQGHIIMDFSLFDAVAAGFERVVFVIKKENEKDFKEVIGERVSRFLQVDYVYQDINEIPAPYKVPEGRVKPWGTGQAVLASSAVADSSIVVINADDYYGKSAFTQIYDYLMTHEDQQKYQYAMVGYVLENTLTENGHVARGVCETDHENRLTGITERTRIERRGEETAYTEDDGATWQIIPKGSIVSMNMWGFTNSILKELENRFPAFLEEGLKENPMKCEYFLPNVVGELIQEGKAEVTLLKSYDKWYGVTYKEDKQMVMDAIRKMKEDGLYPEKLWEK